eukprot:9033726-Pyramimonas_sp.AAC.1
MRGGNVIIVDQVLSACRPFIREQATCRVAARPSAAMESIVRSRRVSAACGSPASSLSRAVAT